MEAHSDIIQRLAKNGVIFSGGGVNPMGEALVASLMREPATDAGAAGAQKPPLDASIVTLVEAYSRRCTALCTALKEHGFEVSPHPVPLPLP